MALALSFFVGVLASLVASGLLVLRNRARYRLRFHSILLLIDEMARQIHRDDFKFDYILAIGRNSGVVGSILAGQFGLSAVVSVSTAKRRLGNGQRATDFDAVSRAVLPALASKRVLIVICCNDSGGTLKYVVDTIEAQRTPPSEIRTASLYTSPSPLLMPTYNGVVLERDSKQSMTKILACLPWVSAKWIHPFSDERLIP